MRCINKFQTYLLLIVFAITISNGCKKSDNVTALTTVTDYNDNVYHTIVIGTQTWTVENLKVTHYRNGDSIANVTGNSVWKSLIVGCNAKKKYHEIPIRTRFMQTVNDNYGYSM